MTINFKWTVEKMTVNPSLDGQTNVVLSVDWLCVATDDVNNLTASISGIQKLGGPSNPFTPYNNLTEAEVLAWCYQPVTTTWVNIDKTTESFTSNLETDIQAQLTIQIQNKLASISANPPLPWSTSKT